MKANKGAPLPGRLFFVLAVLVPLLSQVQSGNAQSAAPPNIIVVMADDHAQWALGAYGLDQLDTPNIDWLAAQGVLFEDAMSPAPRMFAGASQFLHGQDAVSARCT